MDKLTNQNMSVDVLVTDTLLHMGKNVKIRLYKRLYICIYNVVIYTKKIVINTTIFFILIPKKLVIGIIALFKKNQSTIMSCLVFVILQNTAGPFIAVSSPFFSMLGETIGNQFLNWGTSMGLIKAVEVLVEPAVEPILIQSVSIKKKLAKGAFKVVKATTRLVAGEAVLVTKFIINKLMKNGCEHLSRYIFLKFFRRGRSGFEYEYDSYQYDSPRQSTVIIEEIFVEETASTLAMEDILFESTSLAIEGI